MTATPSPQAWDARPPQPEKKKRKHHYFLWFFLLVQVFFLIWIFGGATDAAGSMKDCSGLSTIVPPDKIFSPKEQCEADNAAAGVGTGIGVALIIGLWLAVDFILGLSYGIYKLATRK